MLRYAQSIASWIVNQGVPKGTAYVSAFTLVTSQIITCNAYFFTFGYLPVQTIFITPIVTILIATPVALVFIQLMANVINSEDKYVMAVEAMHGLLWEWDAESQTLKTFPGRFDSHELEAFNAEGAGQRFSLLVHPEDRDRYLSAFKSYLRGQTPIYECKYRIRNRSGGYSWVHDRAIGKRDDTGRFSKIVGAVQILSDRADSKRPLEKIHSETTEQRDSTMVLSAVG